jgi:hypothetical protein
LDDGDEGHLNQGNEDDTAHVGDVMGWVNFNMHCKGGQQMEASVLKLYKVSTTASVSITYHLYEQLLPSPTLLE